MKRIITGITAAVMLMGLTAAFAGSAGTSSDPIASVSYLNGTYKTSLEQSVANEASAGLDAAFDDASAALEEVYDTALMRTGGYSGYALSDGSQKISIASGQSVSALTGASFVLTSGSAVVTVSHGTVINLSTGKEVRAGSSLTLNQKYFCAEYTQAKFSATSAGECLVDGYFSASGGAVTPASFKDVAQSQWFYSQVMYCVNIGLFKGTSDTEFSPAMTMNMAQLVQVLYRIAGNEDASGEYWYSAAEAWAVKAGVVTQAEFSPAAAVTRERFITMFYTTAKYLGTYDMSKTADITGATDYASVGSASKTAVAWAVAVKLIVGTDASKLTISPTATINRAEVCTMIQRFYQSL